MRLLPAALLVVVVQPLALWAQSTTLPPGVFAPLPTIGLPLPPLGLPLPPMGLSPRTDTGTAAGQGRPPADGPRHRGAFGRDHDRQRQTPSTFVYVVPAYGWDFSSLTRSASAVPAYQPPRAVEPRPAKGRLRLEVEPRRLLQIFVDGYYVGTPDDFDGELDAGSHTVTLRAAGYEDVELPVRVPAGDSIVYRGALRPIDTRPPAVDPASSAAVPAAPVASSTLYVIPGCYAGNVPPTAVELPPSCDRRQVITIPPSGVRPQ